MVVSAIRRTGPVALVGGAGFIGSSIAGALIAVGRPVRIIDVTPPTSPIPGATFLRSDATDLTTLAPALAGCEAAVLLAGVMDSASRADPAQGWQINVSGTLTSMEAAIKAGARRIVFLSSAMVYDSGAGAIALAEDSPTAASSLYTAAKLSGEMALRAAAFGGLCAGLALRPFTVFGPGPMDGARGHFIGRWLAQAWAGQPLTLHGAGDGVVDLVRVETVAALVARFLDDPAPSPFMVLNATGGAPLTVAEIAECFCKAAPGLRVVRVSAPHCATRRGWGDPTAMRAFLGADADRLEPPGAALTAFLAKALDGAAAR